MARGKNHTKTKRATKLTSRKWRNAGEELENACFSHDKHGSRTKAQKGIISKLTNATTAGTQTTKTTKMHIKVYLWQR